MLSCSILANVMDWNIVISEFELLSRNHIHFWKRYEPSYPPPAIDLIILLLTFSKDGFGINLTTKVEMTLNKVPKP